MLTTFVFLFIFYTLQNEYIFVPLHFKQQISIYGIKRTFLR